jgi:hypothetical protein
MMASKPMPVFTTAAAAVSAWRVTLWLMRWGTTKVTSSSNNADVILLAASQALSIAQACTVQQEASSGSATKAHISKV